MQKRAMTVEDLWALPRVGAPAPAPDGSSVVVPVTTYSMESNKGTTRLWHLELAAGGARRAGGGSKSKTPRPLTADDVSSSAPVFSPDGRRVAFFRKPGPGKVDLKAAGGPKYTEEAQLYILSLDGGEAQRCTDLPFGAADAHWFPDGRRIAFVSEVYREARDLAATAKRKQERDEDPVKAAVSEDRLFRFWDHWLTEGKVHHIFVLDLETRALVDVTPELETWIDLSEPSDSFSISPDGREIAFAACRSKPPYSPIRWGVFTVKLPARITADARIGRPRSLTPSHPADAMHPIHSPDGRWLVYGMNTDLEFYADRVRLMAIDRETGEHRALTEDWKYSPTGWAFGADAKQLVVETEVRGKTAFFTLDVGAAARRRGKVAPRLLARGGGFGAPRVAGGHVFATRASLSAPPEAWCVDLRGRRGRFLTSFTAPVLKELEMGEVREEFFTGADGKQVQMYLVLPPRGADGAKVARGRGRNAGPAKPLPMVQMIHGGPHGAFNDDWHWRWNAQCFAAPGYLAVLVNFHGSTGWGQRFAQCIQGSWGRQPYEDIMAATDHLIAKGWVDRKRMAATGGSYGGYLASWIASQTDRFACIINHAGVADFHGQFGSDITQDDMRSMGGSFWKNLDGMDRYNPIRHAGGFRSPMLVIHGEKDYRVPYGEGITVYNTYKALELPARLVIYPDENHWILKPRNSRHWYGEVHAWLARWIGRGAKTPAKPAARPKRAARRRR